MLYMYSNAFFTLIILQNLRAEVNSFFLFYENNTGETRRILLVLSGISFANVIAEFFFGPHIYLFQFHYNGSNHLYPAYSVAVTM